jgi:phenylacetate-CoA ligase
MYKIMHFTPDIEYQPQPVIKSFQEGKLHELLEYLKERSPYYRDLFEKEKIDPARISSIEDLKLIPPTRKSDLQTNNQKFLCVDKGCVTDYMTTSGTLGSPVTFALTSADLDRLAYNEALSFTCAGGRPGEVYQLMTTIDKRFMAGLAYYLGIRLMGGSIARVGNGNPELQWDTIERISPESIICVPSFILKVISYAEHKGIDYRKSSIKRAICIGENLREPDFSLNLLGKKIKEKWNIELYSTYASTEMATTFAECSFGCGGHHHPELIITELLDKDDNPVMEGEFGELTITTLGVEAMPLLRFKTGDIARFHYEPCRCGRTTMRISPILGRMNQMIKYKGTTLYPSSVFDVLNHADNVENYIVEVFTNDCGTDELVVKIGCKNPSEIIEKELKDSFRAKLRVAPEVIFMPIEQITAIQNPELNRKPVKFFDNRKTD